MHNCRPPNNRNPEADEVASCLPFLEEQIRLISPRVVVTLGTFAAQAVLGTDEPIGRLRGRWKTAHGVRVIPTFHPSTVLRQGGKALAESRADFVRVKRVLTQAV